MMKKKVSVLGSTGSIGRQTLDVLRTLCEEFEVYALCAGHDSPLLREQIKEFEPKYAGVAEHASFLFDGTLFSGEKAAEQIAALDETDIVVMGISGFAGLLPLLAALKKGKTVALANKESIVCGNQLVKQAISQYGGRIIPVDSEQSAIFQCMQNGTHGEIANLILTASGGPFWQLARSEIKNITVEQALKHPTWQMGRKITIDSATLFNKGLEIIEASYLFDIPAEQIKVYIHPQSIVHSMVEYCDTTVMAQMSCPDMRLAIQYALTYPKREKGACRALSLTEVGTLSFHAVDQERFPAIRLAYMALRAGGTFPTAYNAANEEAVALFLDGRIGFTDIDAAVEHVLERMPRGNVNAVEDILQADAHARKLTHDWYCAL